MEQIAAPQPWTFPGKEPVWHMSRSQIARLAELAAEHEREACAKVCEEHAADAWDHEGGALACADKIRMRSNVEFSGTPAASSPEAPLERRVGGQEAP